MPPTPDTKKTLRDVFSEYEGDSFTKPTLAVSAVVYAFTSIGVFVTVKKLVQVVGKLK